MTGKTTPARPPLNLGGDQTLDGTYQLGTEPRIAPLTPCGSCVLFVSRKEESRTQQSSPPCSTKCGVINQ